MSKFTGKSDFYDLCFDHYTPEEVLKADVYIDNNKIDFCNDVGLLILYGPYLISSMAASKKDDNTSSLTIYLTNKSYIDEREQEELFWYWMTAKNFILKSKKNDATVFDGEWFHKYIDNLDKGIMLKVFPIIGKSDKLKLTKLPKTFSDNDPACQFERRISADVLKDIHLPYWNDRRSELVHEFMEHSNRNYPIARDLLDKINRFNKEKFE